MLIYIIICENRMSRYFSKKLRKNDKKIPDDVDAGEKDTYLWEKGNNENENTEKCGFHGDDMIGKQVGAERVYDFTEKEMRV